MLNLPSSSSNLISLKGTIAVAAAWLFGLGLTLLASEHVESSLSEMLVAVCVGSGLIAFAASLPGALIEAFRRKPVAGSPDRVLPVTAGFFVGVLIRLAGTVALAALCRYQLPASSEQIAAAILLWYVYLTAVEVVTLAFALSDYAFQKRDSLLSSGREFAEPSRSKVNPSVQ
ncbi:hypothetical protein [Roseiconus lacunae]|uniref:Uncharacterized protein n=1 Tax=Roseiconus lacunae TaxID=2605694 RepID=A0ABT7PM79_9BACT|nr:hypothetical protein [Roseiconus lacunae]MDM4017608.1 hypothetical protein [Roseiconus lacunae]